MRVACVRIPDFAVWARRRFQPELAREPVVIGPLPPERGPIVAASPEARARGIRPGMAVPAAQAVLPAARFLPPDPELEQRARCEIEDLLHRFTPTVETVRPHGTFFLDLRGLARHHPSEEAFAARLRSALGALGHPASIGVAGTRFAARTAAAEARGRLRIVPPGTETAFLGPLPLRHLPADEAQLEELGQLGLRTLGDLAALPAEAVAARFGRPGAELHALARGEDPTPLAAALEAGPPGVELELDDPEEDLDRLVFQLRRAVDALLRELARRGLAVSGVSLALGLDDHSETRREARFVRPMLSSRLLLDCLRLELAREPLGARVARLRLEARETAPARAEQLLLFARRSHAADPAAVEDALARVRALVGPDGLVAPRPFDTWRPEARIAWQPYEGPPSTSGPASPTAPRSATDRLELPTRLLSPPQPAEVALARGRLVFLRAPLATGRVRACDGPHRLEGDWWGESFDREYWSATLADGGCYWLYRDRVTGAWSLQGVFD